MVTPDELPKLREAYEALQQENAQLMRQRDHWIQARRETWEAGELIRADRDHLAGEVERMTKANFQACMHLEAADVIAAAAQALVEKLALCQPAIDSAFLMGQVHGAKYSGPTYGDELAALKSLLEAQ